MIKHFFSPDLGTEACSDCLGSWTLSTANVHGSDSWPTWNLQWKKAMNEVSSDICHFTAVGLLVHVLCAFVAVFPFKLWRIKHPHRNSQHPSDNKIHVVHAPHRQRVPKEIKVQKLNSWNSSEAACTVSFSLGLFLSFSVLFAIWIKIDIKYLHVVSNPLTFSKHHITRPINGSTE